MSFEQNTKNIIVELTEKIRELQARRDLEIAKLQAGLHCGIEHGKVVFEEEVLKRLSELKIGLWQYIRQANPRVAFASLVIYLGIPVFLALHLFVWFYQAVCFPVYGIPKVKVSEYLLFDRSRLPYLNALQKFNCAYCSYGNGIIAYAREVASLTEQYWCPLKHYKNMTLGYHERYGDFAEFGDAEAFEKLFMKSPADEEKTEKREC